MSYTKNRLIKLSTFSRKNGRNSKPENTGNFTVSRNVDLNRHESQVSSRPSRENPGPAKNKAKKCAIFLGPSSEITILRSKTPSLKKVGQWKIRVSRKVWVSGNRTSLVRPGFLLLDFMKLAVFSSPNFVAFESFDCIDNLTIGTFSDILPIDLKFDDIIRDHFADTR